MSNFPTGLDNLVDPTATSKLNSPSHSQQHINSNDAIEKIEAKVGIVGSGVTTSHEYRVVALETLASEVAIGDKIVSRDGVETLTGKTLTLPKINEDVELETKSTELNLIKDVSGATGSSTSEIVLSEGPTLVKPIVNGSTQALTTDEDNDTIIFDLAESNYHKVVMEGNRALTILNGAIGDFFTLELIQDVVGSRIPTWFATINWGGGGTVAAPTLTTTANRKDIFTFHITGLDTYDGFIVGVGY